MPSGTAIFELQVTVTKRTQNGTGKRQSALAGAAYRSGEALRDELTGELHDYRNKQDVWGAEILAPDNAPDWVFIRSELWNRHEAKEKRKDAQIYREVRVALPKALKPAENRSLLLEWAQEEFVNRGMVADIGFHDMTGNNPHAHIMLTMRDLLPDGFGNKNRMWNKFMPVLYIPKSNRKVDFKSLVDEWRERWSNHVNHYLEKLGFNQRISHLSNAKQTGVADLETVNIPQSAYHLAKREKFVKAVEYAESAKIRNEGRIQKSNYHKQLNEIFGVNSHIEFLQKLNNYNSYKQALNNENELGHE